MQSLDELWNRVESGALPYLDNEGGSTDDLPYVNVVIEEAPACSILNVSALGACSGISAGRGESSGSDSL